MPWPVSPAPGPSANEAQMGMMSLCPGLGPLQGHPRGCRTYALKQIMGHTQSSCGSLAGGAGSRPGTPFPSSCVSSYWQFHTRLHPATCPRSPSPPRCPGCLFVVKLWPRVACVCVPVGDIGLWLYLFSVSRPIATPSPYLLEVEGGPLGPLHFHPLCPAAVVL